MLYLQLVTDLAVPDSVPRKWLQTFLNQRGRSEHQEESKKFSQLVKGRNYIIHSAFQLTATELQNEKRKDAFASYLVHLTFIYCFNDMPSTEF